MDKDIKNGDNPIFTLENFYEVYPQFSKTKDGKNTIPDIVAIMYLNMAHSCIKESRWNEQWRFAMCLFIAHFCTLYLQGITDAKGGIEGVVEAGKAKGVDTSISVGDVSVTTDYSIATSNLNGWNGWSLTIYGQQLITMGRLVGMGAMYIS